MQVHPEQDDAPLAPPTRRETLVPAVAVAAVAIVAVTAAVMATRADPEAPPTVLAQAVKPSTNADVVRAPPLASPDTRSMGASAQCKACGVVQLVVAVHDHGSKEPRAYQMHVRMDDGTLRTIEQRGALPAGSRVVVQGDSVRPMS